jgi:hypothetical protein
MKMENFVKDEAAKVNAVDCWSLLEEQVAGDIATWILAQPKKFPKMEYAINAYWNERLN